MVGVMAWLIASESMDRCHVTGFDAKGLDKITEIGCVEVIDFIPTGETFHAYLDPQRDIPEKVTEITGLTREFLTGKPLFADVAQDFLYFVKDSNLVAHNADFDRGFINAELERAGFDPVPKKQFVDTLRIARSMFPGSPASLGLSPGVDVIASSVISDVLRVFAGPSADNSDH